MGKERIDKIFREKLAAKEKLFVPYMMAGDGGLDTLEEKIAFLEKCGVSAIELGIPFSDPIADGPVIQQAGIRALESGTTLASVLEKLSVIRKKYTVPIILMSYINPIFQYGIEKFARDCLASGVDGVIIPDIPMEEEGIISPHLAAYGIACIRLAAMTSPPDRIKKIAERTEGFLYAVSVMGTTGARNAYAENISAYLRQLKENSPVPVLAGFGVSSGKQARYLSQYCDGVIVGSKIVDLFFKGKREEIKRLIESSLSGEPLTEKVKFP